MLSRARAADQRGSVLRRVYESLRGRGLRTTLTVSLSVVAARLRRLAVFASECWFDAWHGVETRGVTWQRDFGPSGPAVQHAVHYVGTYTRPFKRFLRSLPIEYGAYHFVDLGSGKGKALLLAAEYPFSSVTGVELVPRFTAIASANLAHARHLDRVARQVALVTGDASKYDFPCAPLVVYLHNPFDGFMVSRVLANMEIATRSGATPSYIVYHGPRHREVVEAVPWLKVLKSERKCVIYVTAPTR
jgi:SAM-dependent methyltransferase